jgi:uncharacterized protein HemY
MSILLRYVCLLSLGYAAIVTFLSASAVTGQRLAASGGYAVQDPADSGFLVLAVIGLLGLFSIVSFVVRGPSRFRDWQDRRRYERRRSQYGSLVLACIIGVVFLVL